jgi:hypothetical protein
MVVNEYLINALKDLGYSLEVGDVEIRGFNGQRTQVEMKIATNNPGYDIGFLKQNDTYECVADWWGLKDIDQEKFLKSLLQRYAYHAAMAELTQQGFAVAKEENQSNGEIHLTLRRTV